MNYVIDIVLVIEWLILSWYMACLHTVKTARVRGVCRDQIWICVLLCDSYILFVCSINYQIYWSGWYCGSILYVHRPTTQTAWLRDVCSYRLCFILITDLLLLTWLLCRPLFCLTLRSSPLFYFALFKKKKFSYRFSHLRYSPSIPPSLPSSPYRCLSSWLCTRSPLEGRASNSKQWPVSWICTKVWMYQLFRMLIS